jgi:hypothetical protein
MFKRSILKSFILNDYKGYFRLLPIIFALKWF